MNMVKRCFIFVLAIACLTACGIVSACAVDTDALQAADVFAQLCKDIAIIENVKLDNLQEFKEANSEWLADVNARVETYLETIPEEQHRDVLIRLRGDNPNVRDAYDYFDSYTYHLRNGYYTYSMTPKMSTRLIKAYAEAGWDELSQIYYYIRTDTGSLYMQYMCHFDLFVEEDWDIERGVPEVKNYADMLSRLCNPQKHDGYID